MNGRQGGGLDLCGRGAGFCWFPAVPLLIPAAFVFMFSNEQGKGLPFTIVR